MPLALVPYHFRLNFISLYEIGSKILPRALHPLASKDSSRVILSTYLFQDDSQIRHALNQYRATAAPLSTESIQELLSVARTVGNVRPKNLIKALKGYLLYLICFKRSAVISNRSLLRQKTLGWDGGVCWFVLALGSIWFE